MSAKHIFTVWFRDRSLPSDDQDYEWPASFIVLADTELGIDEWANAISRRYARQRGLEMISSNSIRFDDSDLPAKDTLPELALGSDPTDDDIGW